MAFRVEIAPEALGDLDRIATFIRERSSDPTAERWLQGIFAALRSLAEMPERCALAEESAYLGVEVRVLLYGKRKRRYKVYFEIHPETMILRVFHVRHWARKPAEADELAELMDEFLESEDD